MQLPQDWNLPAAIRARLGANTTGRQRAMVAEGHLLLVLHRVPRHGERQRRGIYFWRDPDGRWASSGKKLGIPTLPEHVNAFGRAADELEARYQSAGKARDYFLLLKELAPLLRTVTNLYATLQSAREAIPGEPGIISVRDTAGDVLRSLELLSTEAKHALDYDVARSSEEQAILGEEAVRSGVRLNVLAALFLPITMLSGMFGMNLESGLEGSPPWFSWALFAFGLGLGLVVRGWVMRGVPPEIVKPRLSDGRRL